MLLVEYLIPSMLHLFISFVVPLIVPKRDPSEFRLIHHLSYHQVSFHVCILTDCSPVHYVSHKDAISDINKTGAVCFMAKTDVKSAFRLRPIHPNDYSLLNMKRQNLFSFDRCLSLGISSSCAIVAVLIRSYKIY